MELNTPCVPNRPSLDTGGFKRLFTGSRSGFESSLKSPRRSPRFPAPGSPSDTKKWQGVVRVILAAPVEKVWNVVSDFSSISTWDDHLISSEIVSGRNYRPGCVRCLKYKLDGKQGSCNERLIDIDPANHQIQYTIECPNPFNYSNFESTIKVSPHSNGTSVVEWSYELDGMIRVPYEVLANKLTSEYIKMLSVVEDLALS